MMKSHSRSMTLGLLLMGCLLVLTGYAQDPKPNVIFILVDDMGYGDIGSYGVTDTRTPNLDRLAHQGVRFINSYSNGPVCSPTRAAFITGRYQQRVGIEYVLSPAGPTPPLRTSENSVAR